MHDGQPQPDPPAGLAELPSWVLGRVTLTAQRLVGDALAEHGLRRQHFAVLLALAERVATSQAELGRRLRIDRSDMHAIIDLLATRRFVVQARDEGDRRRHLVELTADGVDGVAVLAAQVREAQSALLAPLSPDERTELQRLLVRLQQHHERVPNARRE